MTQNPQQSQPLPPTKTPAPPPVLPRWILDVQVFLLRHRLMGPMNKQLMVITTTGRKSGKKFALPIGFVHDGDSIMAFNIGGTSNWYKNVLANGTATLEIGGKTMHVRAEPLTERADIAHAYDTYKREQPSMFPRFFGSSAETPTEDLINAGGRVVFVRFRPVSG